MPRTPDTPTPEKTHPPALAGEWAQVFDLMPVGLVLLDDDLAVLHTNRFARRVFGPGEDWLAVWSEHAAAPAGRSWRDVFAAVRDGAPAERLTGITFARDEQPSARTFDVEATLLDRGDRRAVLVVLIDVTRETELAERAQAADNLAAVGRLAARVAHELNNPLDGTLRYVSLSARYLEKQVESGAVDAAAAAKLNEYFMHAREGILRMTRIVAELLEFSRNSPVLPDSGNINRIVEEALQALAHHADANHVAMMADFHDDNHMPALAGTKLYQVCCNLIRNAIDAMPDGGTLTVRTGIVERQVIIRVTDTGPGLPEEVERVFEPFYSTKPAGKGTGLGLAICREYVAQIGGTIKGENARSENGRDGGAVFTVRIPVERCRQQANSTRA